MTDKRSTPNRTTMLEVGLVAALLFALVGVLSEATVPNVQPGEERGGNDADSGRVSVAGHVPSRVPESSGVAVSRVREDLMWTHNDGRGDNRLYALRHDGTLLGSVTVRGASPVDWEDLAAGPCPGAPSDSGGSCLYIADTGDNAASRSGVRIVVVREPDMTGGGVEVVPLAVASFRYPEGPADAEALAVTSAGDALVVTKGVDGAARLYRIGADAFSQFPEDTPDPAAPGSLASLEATLPIDVRGDAHRVTGAALSPDGRRLAVRTLSEIYLFDVDDWTRAPRVCPLGDREPQGEAVDFVDDETLILTSESRGGGRAPILRVRCG